MKVSILDDLCFVPSSVYMGRLVVCGREGIEIIFLLEDATQAQALQYSEKFCRKSGFKPMYEPLTIPQYNDLVRNRRRALDGDNRI